MTDYTPIVNAFFGTLTVAITGYMTYVMTRLKGNQAIQERRQARRDRVQARRDKRTAQRVNEVKETLEVSTTATRNEIGELKVMGAATHKFVNREMGIKKLRLAQALRKLAEMTGDEGDRQAADEADKEYASHQAAQAAVDLQPGTDAEKKGEATPAPPQTVGQVVGQTAKDVKEIHKVVVKVVAAEKESGESEG